MFLDSFVSAYPLRFGHLLYAYPFGVTWLVWSGVFHAADLRLEAFCSCTNGVTGDGCYVEDGTSSCNYIYELTNYHRPVEAVVTVAAIVVVLVPALWAFDVMAIVLVRRLRGEPWPPVGLKELRACCTSAAVSVDAGDAWVEEFAHAGRRIVPDRLFLAWKSIHFLAWLAMTLEAIVSFSLEYGHIWLVYLTYWTAGLQVWYAGLSLYATIQAQRAEDAAKGPTGSPQAAQITIPVSTAHP